MNKETKQIYRKLEKDLKKNRAKLLKLCKKYVTTQDDVLTIDIEYYSELIYQDSQSLNLILIATDCDE